MKESMRGGLVSTSGVSVPLRGVAAEGELVGGVLRMRVRQRYENVERAPIEAIYTFPLPSDAAVVGFVMESGGRRLEGMALEREEAFKKYDDALVSGHGAALVDQERANVFTASVGNVLAGETVTIEVEYVERVGVDEGSLRLSIPTLVAPRYVPGKPAGDRTSFGVADPTDRVPDADRVSPKIADVDYEISLALALHVDARAKVSSPSHAIVVEEREGVKHARFAHGAVALDRDIVVNVEAVSSGSGMDAIAAHRVTSGDGYVAITHVADLSTGKAPPLSVVFVVDRSGSMGGLSIEEARRALRLALRQLREGDRFTILAFDDRVEELSSTLLPFTNETLRRADQFIASVDARGGTEMLAPLVRASSLAQGGIVVLLTDGQVANEAEILETVLRGAGGTRFYTFGIGTNVSDVLLGELARRSNGAKELVYPGERIDDKVVATFAKATARRVRDVRIDTNGLALEDVVPSAASDLVDGEPFTIFARYTRPGVGSIAITGTLDGQRFHHAIPITLPEHASATAVPKLWAKERVRELEGMAVEGRRAASMKERIVSLCKEHGLASRYTSFVVVETRSGDRKTTEAASARAVPVSAPHGWSMFDARTRGFGAAVGGRASTGAMPPMPSMASPAPMGGSYGGPPPSMPVAPRRMGAMSAPAARPAAPAAALPAGTLARGHTGQAAGTLSKKNQSVLASIGRALGFGEDGAGDTLDEVAAPADFARASATIDVPTQGSGDPILDLLTTQRASGLFADGNDLAALTATVDALSRLVREGITSGHARYGEQIKRAIEALITLAISAKAPPATFERALAVAFLAASGRRTRALVESAIDAHTPALRTRLPDDAAMRASAGL
jgi:Ca-activated chloride channel family protein